MSDPEYVSEGSEEGQETFSAFSSGSFAEYLTYGLLFLVGGLSIMGGSSKERTVESRLHEVHSDVKITNRKDIDPEEKDGYELAIGRSPHPPMGSMIGPTHKGDVVLFSYKDSEGQINRGYLPMQGSPGKGLESILRPFEGHGRVYRREGESGTEFLIEAMYHPGNGPGGPEYNQCVLMPEGEGYNIDYRERDGFQDPEDGGWEYVRGFLDTDE